MKKITGFLFGFLLCTSFAFGMDITFQWGASTGQVEGYRIYSGDVASGPYPEMMGEVNGTTLTQTLTLDNDREYYLVCRAFNVYGESGNSNEVHLCYAVPGIPGTLQWTIWRALVDNLSQVLESLDANQIQFVVKMRE